MDLEPEEELPPGYPTEYQREEVLRDGRRVAIRPILPGDAAELAEAIRTADAETLRRRFLGGPPEVTAALMAHLTVVDYERRFALVAIDVASGQGVAIARYEPAGEGIAEIAVAVRPAWRHAGLGTLLMLFLAKAAAERGVRSFTASYQAENRPVAALVEDVGGLSTQVIEHGIADFSLALGPGQPTTDTPAPGVARLPGQFRDALCHRARRAQRHVCPLAPAGLEPACDHRASVAYPDVVGVRVGAWAFAGRLRPAGRAAPGSDHRPHGRVAGELVELLGGHRRGAFCPLGRHRCGGLAGGGQLP
jgi:GNAT superfamily N-acetyltransferase